jgi:hypothetical protein
MAAQGSSAAITDLISSPQAFSNHDIQPHAMGMFMWYSTKVIRTISARETALEVLDRRLLCSMHAAVFYGWDSRATPTARSRHRVVTTVFPRSGTPKHPPPVTLMLPWWIDCNSTNTLV